MEIPESRISSVFIVGLIQFMVGICLFVSLLYGQRELTILALLVLGIAIGTHLWSRLSFSGIHCTSRVDKHRLFPGESLTLHLSMENTRFLPVWLQVSMHPQAAIDTGFGEKAFSRDVGLLWYQQAHLKLKMLARRRGVYRLGSARIKVGDIFGFFPRERRIAGDIEVVVYPRLVPLKPFSLPRRDFFGIPGAKSPVKDPIYILGTRDYQQGQPARHIHWKASARHTRLQEKVFDPSEQGKVILTVAVNAFEKAGASAQFERTLEVVGSLAVQFYQRGYALGLVANGLVEGGTPFLSMGRSPQQLPAVLELLARLKMKADGNLTDTLHRVLKLPWGVSCVHFSYGPDEGTGTMAQYLSHRRIPMNFVDCASRFQLAENGHGVDGRESWLDEIFIGEPLKP